MFKKLVIVSGMLFMALGGNSVLAADNDSNNECPVGFVNGMDLDDEFGPGTSELTRCVERRNQVKVVMQINRFCRDDVPNSECASNRAFALGNIRNMIKDYEITQGMQQGKDYEIVAVVHSGGGMQLLKDQGTGRNQFEQQVKDLMEQGVKFYFCQNTTRGFIKKGILPAYNATAQLIDGVEYVTAGVTAIADFQAHGYHYVQP